MNPTDFLDDVGVAVTVTDGMLESPGPTILYVNRAAEELFGYTTAEMVGQTPRMFQGPRTELEVLDRLKVQLRRGEHFLGRTFNYRKDGSEFALEWSASPILGHDGAIAFVAFQREVTDASDPAATLGLQADLVASRFPGEPSAEAPSPALHAYMAEQAREAGLTAREQEVFLSLLEHAELAEVADGLLLSPRTVKFHLSNVYGKFGVSNRQELTSLLLKRLGTQL